MDLVKDAKIYDRVEWLSLALVITFASHAIPFWAAVWLRAAAPEHFESIVEPYLGFENYLNCLEVLFGLVLVLPTWRRSGLCIGRIREHWRGTMLVCALPILVAALVYPHLPQRPFANAGIGMCLISPFAQDLVFTGYLFGRLDVLFPGYVHPRLPWRKGLLITAVYFALWHSPGLVFLPGYTIFQMAYCFVGACIVGLSRQWTGSLLYGTMMHMIINAIAWATP